MQKQQKQSVSCALCGEKVPLANLPIHKIRCSMKMQSKLVSQTNSTSALRQTRTRKSRIFDQTKQQKKQQIQQKIKCTFCGYLQTFAELDSHPGKCPGVNFICQYCNEGYPSELMQQHESLCQANSAYQSDEEAIQLPLERLRHLFDLINSINLLVRNLSEQEAEGLSKQKMQELKRFKYKSKKEGQQDQLCTICYCQFQAGEQGIQLKCHHIYHHQCIQKWLQQSQKCPVCKHNQNLQT